VPASIATEPKIADESQSTLRIVGASGCDSTIARMEGVAAIVRRVVTA